MVFFVRVKKVLDKFKITGLININLIKFATGK